VLFTRSIRQKLIWLLVLVMVMVAGSTWASFVGVSSIQSTVSDFELSVQKIPRRDNVIASFSRLFVPLAVAFPGMDAPLEYRQDLAERQQAEVARVFADVQERITEFKDGWQRLDDKLRHSHAEQLGFRTLWTTADSNLRTIEEAIPGLGDLDRREMSSRVIMQAVANANKIIGELPDPANRLGERLRDAKGHAAWHQQLVFGLSAGSVVVLLFLILLCYRQIFQPIRDLFQGVSRLAAGDYGYRIKVATQCEIGKLGDAFNEMSRRIQEDRQSKQREIEERSKQLVLSERLAGAGFLASGVAHEINNPLSVIMTAAYGLEMRLGDDVLGALPEADRNDIREYLGLIQSESERCERITKKLLDFSYGKGDERNRYDVTAIVQEVISMVSHLSRYQDRQISIDRTEPLHAWVNAPEVKQVILNLVANALDATGPGGYVDITVREYPEQVEVSVEDNGCGMSPEQMKKIFDPFFTTKQVGKGTGLGLAITHRIVRDHGGTLEVFSDGPGQGSRFTLRLPKTDALVRAA